MEVYPNLSFDSYDRLFPNQDILPEGGFGNLIALPLQREARQAGNSSFVDAELNVIFTGESASTDKDRAKQFEAVLV